MSPRGSIFLTCFVLLAPLCPTAECVAEERQPSDNETKSHYYAPDTRFLNAPLIPRGGGLRASGVVSKEKGKMDADADVTTTDGRTAKVKVRGTKNQGVITIDSADGVREIPYGGK